MFDRFEPQVKRMLLRVHHRNFALKQRRHGSPLLIR
jgi:hypothetical protein